MPNNQMLPLNERISFPFPARVLNFDFRAASVTESGLATVALSLRPLQESEWLIDLFFIGVRDLSIKKSSSEGIDCALFDVTEMRQSRWENVNWLVGDFKIDALAFYAKTAEVVSISEFK